MGLIPFCTYTGFVLKPEFAADTPVGWRAVVGLREARELRASQHAHRPPTGC